MNIIVPLLAQAVLVLLLIADDKNNGEKALFVKQQWGPKDLLVLLSMINIFWITLGYLPRLTLLNSYLKHAIPIYLPHLVLLAIVGAVFRLRIKQKMADLGFKRDQHARMGFLFVVVALLLCEILQRFPESGELFFRIKTGISLLVVIPVVEEIIFRGVLYSPYRKKYGPTTAVLLTSIYFAAVHGEMSIVMYVYYTLGGILMGTLYEKTELLIYPIVAHSMINIPGFILPIRT